LSGIFDFEDFSNPFKDWNVVYLPYCTGDLFIGNAVNTYEQNSEQMVIHHKGRSNVQSAIAWVSSNYENPDKILISGESAGAYGAAFWAPKISSLNKNSQIYQLSDGSLLESERWREVLDTVWKSEAYESLGFIIKTDIYENALLDRTDSSASEIKYLHSNTIYDEVMNFFNMSLNHSSKTTKRAMDIWSEQTKASMKRLASSDLDYEYFISECGLDSLNHTTVHTIVGNLGYKICKSDNIAYRDWLKKNVIDEESISLGSKLLGELDLPAY
jgi:hypothetical protein